MENHKLTEFTNKTHKLTEFLVNNNSKIVIPEFIIREINNKSIRKILDEYIASNQISNLSSNPTIKFKLCLEFRIKNKFNKLLDKNWFIVKEYNPSQSSIYEVENFFKS